MNIQLVTAILKHFFISLKLNIFSFLGSNLSDLFIIAGTPKHKKAYDAFCGLVDKKKINNILEIGIGGHDDPFKGGRSLLALKNYFKRALVIGADISKKNNYLFNRIQLKLLDQSKNDNVKYFGKKYGKFDLIIDDGSHFCKHQINSFNNLFQFLDDGAFYIIEDTNNSYKNAGGGSTNLKSSKSTVNYFKDKVHAINSVFLIKSERRKLKKFLDISFILFFPGIIIIQKKKDKKKPKSDKYLKFNLNEFNEYWSKKKGKKIEKKRSGILSIKKI